MTGPCRCLCPHWGHLGRCTGEGSEIVAIPNDGPGPSRVEALMCGPCAKDVTLKLDLVGAYA